MDVYGRLEEDTDSGGSEVLGKNYDRKKARFRDDRTGSIRLWHGKYINRDD